MKIRPCVFSLVFAAVLASLASGTAQASGPYQITGTAESRDDGFVRTEFTVQAGSHPSTASRWCA